MRFFPIKIKKDYILIMLIVIPAAASALVTAAVQRGAEAAVRVTIDGTVYGEYSLSEEQVITIDRPSGYNQIVIENGTAYMGEADCPDRYCMDYRPISKGNETIICLPHRLVVEVVGESDGQQPDAVAGAPGSRGSNDCGEKGGLLCHAHGIGNDIRICGGTDTVWLRDTGD